MRIGLGYEAKLKRFQEVQARKKARDEKRANQQREKENRKLMSQSHRSEVAKHLKEQIAVTTDPKQLAELTREFNKLSRLRKGKRKPSKTVSVPKGNLPDGKQVFNRMVDMIEAKRRKYERELTQTEKDTTREEVLKTLSEEERLAIEQYCATVA
jgi:hypothetical protein